MKIKYLSEMIYFSYMYNLQGIIKEYTIENGIININHNSLLCPIFEIRDKLYFGWDENENLKDLKELIGTEVYTVSEIIIKEILD